MRYRHMKTFLKKSSNATQRENNPSRRICLKRPFSFNLCTRVRGCGCAHVILHACVIARMRLGVHEPRERVFKTWHVASMTRKHPASQCVRSRNRRQPVGQNVSEGSTRRTLEWVPGEALLASFIRRTFSPASFTFASISATSAIVSGRSASFDVQCTFFNPRSVMSRHQRGHELLLP